MGLATDIIESSAQALIHVINSIWRADQVAEQMERNVAKQTRSIRRACEYEQLSDRSIAG